MSKFTLKSHTGSRDTATARAKDGKPTHIGNEICWWNERASPKYSICVLCKQEHSYRLQHNLTECT